MGLMNRLFGASTYAGSGQGRIDVTLTVEHRNGWSDLVIAPTGGNVVLTAPSGKEISIKDGDTFALDMADSSLTIQGLNHGV